VEGTDSDSVSSESSLIGASRFSLSVTSGLPEAAGTVAVAGARKIAAAAACEASDIQKKTRSGVFKCLSSPIVADP